MRKTKAIIFDFDGTLVNSAPGIVATLKELLVKTGKEPMTDEQLFACVGPPIHQFFPDLLGVQAHELENTIAIYRQIFNDTALKKLTLFDGIYDLLRDLKARGYMLGIATCKHEHTAIEQAEMLGIAHFFDVVGGAIPQENIFEKEDVLRSVLKKLDVLPEEARMIGDRKYDLIGANVNGIPGIGVLYGGCGTKEELLEHHPIAIARDVAQLRQILLEDEYE